jgi:hypothetical protein
MNSTELSDQDLEKRIKQAFDALVPMPNDARLLEIEQQFSSDRTRNKNWFLWVAVLLGLTGLVSAFYYSGIKQAVNSAPVKKPDISEPGQKIEVMDRKTFEIQDAPDSPVIYQQEVIDHEK